MLRPCGDEDLIFTVPPSGKPVDEPSIREEYSGTWCSQRRRM
jgi:hypothetical protein